MIKWLHLYMAVKFSRTAALLAGALSIISCSTRVIRVPLTEGDATPVIQAAIEQAGAFGKRPVTIELQPGDYHLYRESSSSFLYHVSNTTSESENPDPVKHICFWFKGMDNVTLDGNGARLVTHGELTGFDSLFGLGIDLHTFFDAGIAGGDDEALAALDCFNYADSAGTDGSHLFVVAKSRDLDVELVSCL